MKSCWRIMMLFKSYALFCWRWSVSSTVLPIKRLMLSRIASFSSMYPGPRTISRPRRSIASLSSAWSLPDSCTSCTSWGKSERG